MVTYFANAVKFGSLTIAGFRLNHRYTFDRTGLSSFGIPSNKCTSLIVIIYVTFETCFVVVFLFLIFLFNLFKLSVFNL